MEAMKIDETPTSATGTTFHVPGPIVVNAQAWTFQSPDAAPPTSRNYDEFRAISADHLRIALIRLTGRVKTLIDAVIPNATQAKAAKDQAHLAIWSDYDAIRRYAHEFFDEELKQTPTSGSTWRPSFPFVGDEPRS